MSNKPPSGMEIFLEGIFWLAIITLVLYGIEWLAYLAWGINGP